jgi:hypothetical protein
VASPANPLPATPPLPSRPLAAPPEPVVGAVPGLPPDLDGPPHAIIVKRKTNPAARTCAWRIAIPSSARMLSGKVFDLAVLLDLFSDSIFD